MILKVEAVEYVFLKAQVKPGFLYKVWGKSAHKIFFKNYHQRMTEGSKNERRWEEKHL